MPEPRRFFVRGLPVAQPRTKAVRRGQHAGVYTPSTANQWKAQVAQAGYENVECEPDLPLSLRLLFYLPRPKSHYRTGKNAHLLRDSAPRRPTGKPDLDNLMKAVCDALQGIAWRDDAQIVSCEVEKRYAGHQYRYIAAPQAQQPDIPTGVEITIVQLRG